MDTALFLVFVLVLFLKIGGKAKKNKIICTARLVTNFGSNRTNRDFYYNVSIIRATSKDSVNL